MPDTLYDEDCHKLWRIWLTTKQMCNDRGYLVVPDDLELDMEGWKERFGSRPREDEPTRQSLTYLLGHNDNEMDRIFVYFNKDDNVSTNDIKVYVKSMQEGNVQKAIIAYSGRILPLAKKYIEMMKEPIPGSHGGYHIEVFRDKELMINIMRHELVPKHIVLTDEEKTTLCERYGLKESELGRIQHDDPVTRYYGLVPGQVFKIVRSSETAGRYVSYRIVV